MKRWKKALLLVTLTGATLVVLVYVTLQLSGAAEIAGVTSRLSDAVVVHEGMRAAMQDGAFAYPADAHATSARNYIYRLVPKYVSRESAESVLDNFLIANVSESDPPQTILFQMKPKKAGKLFAVLSLGDNAETLQLEDSAEAGPEPARTPPYLAD